MRSGADEHASEYDDEALFTFSLELFLGGQGGGFGDERRLRSEPDSGGEKMEICETNEIYGKDVSV
jgi:hypothetical protein